MASERPPTDRVDDLGISREWLTPSNIPLPSRGRLYTSRRTMTAFACSNLYPIPSRHHEEEEAEEDDIVDKSEQCIDSKAFHQAYSPKRGTTKSSQTYAPPISLCSLHCHTESLQSGDRTQSYERQPGDGVHSRHTSLPNPVSLDVLFSSTGVSGSFSQTNSAQSKDLPEPLAVMRTTTSSSDRYVDETQHLPYYNLSSPEVSSI
ncbi:unnamed protein product [Echinostoma caproni]|uniref:Uncharacterized protein n=1 Tax=Echinostoma caproni TaxID=27848 RepID=A0A183A4U4_9TREM|nr:unnamed protein product [Echinostoma caproni]